MTDETPVVLDLTDLAKVRPKIRLLSGEYELLSSEDFDPIHAAQITKLGNEAEALQMSDLDEEGAKKLDDNLRAQVKVTGITHIKLPGSKQRTILDESHLSITHERRQPSHRAYKTICRRGELAFDGQRRWLSPRLHSLPTPPGTHLALGCLSSPLMTSRIIATLVLDGARRYAPTLAGIPPGTLPPQQAETPTSWHAAPDVHPS